MIIAALYPCPFDPQIRHDVNAAIVRGDTVFACEEDKLTTIKNEPTVHFPERSLMMGCKELGVTPAEVDAWVLPTPRETPRPENLHLFFGGLIKAFDGPFEAFEAWCAERVHYVDHHECHAGLAVHASGFDECAFVSQDGGGDMGDPRNMIYGVHRGGAFEVLGESPGLHNVCSFHAFLTDACGFGGGENGKTSGLAGYGAVQPELARELRALLDVTADGIHFHRERYARTPVNLEKVRPQDYDRNKIFLRVPSDTNVLRASVGYLPQDIAATGESVMQDVFLEFLEKVRAAVGPRRIVFSGGLFQNVALNRAIVESGLFEDCYFPMAPSDSGLALGGALVVRSRIAEGAAPVASAGSPLTPFVGPSFHDDEVQGLLDRFRLSYEVLADPAEHAAELLSQGQVVGWFQGRAEFGPRSLGARSILADPRFDRSRQRVNQRLKRRDWFMPYAPSILEEALEEWVERPMFSPYMQVAFRVKPGKEALIPAAVHVDGTSRMNVVRRSENPSYWRLINTFSVLTGIPAVLNTSFNRHGIATISSPRQAVEHLLEGCMDVLVIGRLAVAFNRNRIAADVDEPTDSDRALLLRDCERRLADVERLGTEADRRAYAARLDALRAGACVSGGDE